MMFGSALSNQLGEASGALAFRVIGPAGEAWTAYDALHDPSLTRRLLEAMAGQETVGPLRFCAEPDAVLALVIST